MVAGVRLVRSRLVFIVYLVSYVVSVMGELYPTGFFVLNAASTRRYRKCTQVSGSPYELGRLLSWGEGLKERGEKEGEEARPGRP